jgi:hypothetical protein
MHPTLVAPFGQCRDTRADLLAALAAVTPARWSWRPQAGRWTLAEQFDHLLRSEVGTSKMARRLIRGDFREAARPPGAPLHDSALDHYPYGRLAAPQGLIPAATLRLEEAAAQLQAAHQRFEEELERFQGPDPDALAAPDLAADAWFTLGGWVRLQALHEAHHLLQIRALMEGP